MSVEATGSRRGCEAPSLAGPQSQSRDSTFPPFPDLLLEMPLGNLLIVFVVPPHPEWPAVILIPAFRNHVQIVIMNVEQFIAARVTRVGVEKVTRLILVEHAVAFPFRRPWILNRVVEERGPLHHLFLGEFDHRISLSSTA